MFDAAVYQIIGVLVLLAGLILFVRDAREGTNSVKIAGMEISVSAPSLIVFVVGALLFAFPFTAAFRDRRSANVEPEPIESASVPASPEPTAPIDEAGSAETTGSPAHAPPVDPPGDADRGEEGVLSQARGVSPMGQEEWAIRIQSNYPTRAAREEREGRVGLRVAVGPGGSVTACSVTASSGSPDLDEAACDGMVRDARFHPALDAAGKPVASSYSTAIVYRLN